MAAAMSPLQELGDAAQSARRLRLAAEFELTPDKRLHVDVSSYRINGTPHWWLSLDEVTDRGTNGQVVTSADVVSAIRHVACLYPKATLLPDSVKMTVEKGPAPASKLRPVAVRAWHEAYGLPIPSLDDLAEQTKARKAAKASASCDLVELLKTGGRGVKAFNALPLRDRRDSDFRKANLAGCRLDRIDFGGADLEGADLSGASLRKAEFWGVPDPTRLKRANLAGADLSDARLARCQGADADFSRAVLKGAWLAWGSFLRAKFVDADLTGATLSGSDLRGADFTGAKLDRLVLEAGKFDEATKWPKTFLVPDDLTWKGTGPDPRKAPTKREKSRPRPTDTTGFLARLKKATDAAKLDKAMAMLKADRFRLFARVTDDHVVGVVKSQSDASLVYSCRLADDGTYSCCTQNLNVCGGLRGSPCKHLLVLIVGLVQAGELDPGTAHDWTQASRGRKPILDKDATTETLLQYKGAEAGEVDWRPTETIPEDFYTL